MATALLACSEGESDVLNPRSPRGGIAARPESTRVDSTDRDRSFRPAIATGASPVLFLANEGDVQSEVYLHFDLSTLPDTAGVESANVGLRFRRTEVSPVRISAYAVSSSEEDWDEATLKRLLDTVEPPFYSSTVPIAPGEGDSLFVTDAVKIPGSLIRSWKNDPETNRGIALRIADGSIGRTIEILAKEAALADTNGNALVNPRLEVFRGDDRTSTLESPDDDAYILTDGTSAPLGDAVDFRVKGRPAERGLLHFALPEVLRKGHTINRALLRIRMVPGSVEPGDSLLIGAYLATSTWDEASEPDSVTRGGAAFDFARVRASSDTLELDCAIAVQHWLDSGENFGLQIRSATEGDDTLSVRFFTREAETELRPSLELIYTPPPDPRWGGDAP